ncbi:MAG: metallophosphoesterase family protein [Planctomycetes bacterium]|nr:metallophosphoesterase family protein [Planctomycetota bacterium]
MRLLLFADVHASLDGARDLVARSGAVDAVVGAGDFARVRRGLGPTIDALAAIARPTVLVPGNNETLAELRAACRAWPAARVLHGTSAEIDGVVFFGLGGGVPVTPFGAWSFDLDEDEAAALLEPCPEGAVLVSHSPPRGVLDRDASGRHLGSAAVRAAIARLRPRLVVCGHIHAFAGQEAELDGCRIVNPGPGGFLAEV